MKCVTILGIYVTTDYFIQDTGKAETHSKREMFEIWIHFFPYQKPILKRVRHRGWRLLVKMCVMRKNLQYVNNWCNRSADDVCKHYFKIVDFKLVRSPCNFRQVCPEKYQYVSNIIWDIFNIQKLLQMKDWIKLLQFMRELL